MALSMGALLVGTYRSLDIYLQMEAKIARS